MSDDNIARLPVRQRQRKVITVVTQPGACQHLCAEVDEKLDEITCADCRMKLNPIIFLRNMAHKLTSWEYEAQQMAKVRAEFEERRKCRCLKCGEWTEIRSVGRQQAERIKAKRT
jgi:hypothetical protein